jgi:CRP/FNR family cyclic AMP-dependent transcriptional regulator
MSFDPELRNIRLLENLADEELEILGMVIRHETYTPGQSICAEGDPGRSCWFVIDGEVDVVKTLSNGTERLLTTLRSSDVFGQVALIDSGARSATCRARAEVRAFRLDRQDFAALFGSGSRFAFRFQLAIARIAASQLRDANRKLNLLLETSRKVDADAGSRAQTLQEVRDMLDRSDASVTADSIRWID